MAGRERPSAVERVRAGDWNATEEVVASAIAPTFDAALHIFEDAAVAERATEEALLELLVAIRKGSFDHEEVLRFTGRELFREAERRGAAPFGSGLDAEDLAILSRPADEARRDAIAQVPPAARCAAVLALSLDLETDDLAWAIDRPAAEAAALLEKALDAVPHERPADALRDVLDARAARTSVPFDVEDRVLDRFEASL